MKKEVLKPTDAQPYKVSQEDIEFYGYTPEEVAIIEQAENLSRVVDYIPADEKSYKAFVDKFNTVVPENPVEAYKVLATMADTDPEFLTQILAISAVLDGIEEMPAPQVESVSVESIKKLQTDINDAETSAKLKAYMDDIANM